MRRIYSSSALEGIHSEELHNHIAEAVERIHLLLPVEADIDHQWVLAVGRERRGRIRESVV